MRKLPSVSAVPSSFIVRASARIPLGRKKYGLKPALRTRTRTHMSRTEQVIGPALQPGIRRLCRNPWPYRSFGCWGCHRASGAEARGRTGSVGHAGGRAFTGNTVRRVARAARPAEPPRRVRNPGGTRRLAEALRADRPRIRFVRAAARLGDVGRATGGSD